MPDYKEMYLKMIRASGKAINELLNAQQECEKMYIESDNTESSVSLSENE